MGFSYPWLTLHQILFTTTTKGTVFYDVYISIYSEQLEGLLWRQPVYWWIQVKSQEPKPPPQRTVWPHKIFQHIRGQVWGSMDADPINMIHTSKQSTKEGLYEEPEGYFISTKAINWGKKIWTPNWNPHHDLPQTYGEKNLYVWFGYGPQKIF